MNHEYVGSTCEEVHFFMEFISHIFFFHAWENYPHLNNENVNFFHVFHSFTR